MRIGSLTTVGCALLTAASAFATAVTPQYTTFGNLAGATFGGSGNPTDPVAITEFTHEGHSFTLGLAAQQRYWNAPLANDGAGTYFAVPGSNYGNPANPGGPGPSSSLGATWNFDYYIDSTSDDYTYKLWMGTDASSLSAIDPLNIADNGSTPNFGGQNSQNLMFFAWGNLSGFELNPLYGSFNPNANADYSFVLEAYDGSDLIGYSSMVVRVGTGSSTSVPDGGATSILLGAALGAMALVRRKFAA